MCGQLRSGEAGLDNSVCAQAAAPALCHMWQCAPQCGDQASLQLPPQPHQASPAGKAKPLSTAVRTTARPVHSASLRAVLLCCSCAPSVHSARHILCTPDQPCSGPLCLLK